MWGDPSSWVIGDLEGGAEPGAGPVGESSPVVPAPLGDGARAGLMPQGSTPLLHPASSAPAPPTIWVPDGPAAMGTLGALPPRPAQPAASAPLPTWLPPSPFDSVAFGGGAGMPPTLRPTASAPLPTLSPFSSGGFDSMSVGDAAHTLQPATLGPLQPALGGLPSGGFESVTSPQQPPAQLGAASQLEPQAPQLPSLPYNGLGGMHQPTMLPHQPPSPPLAMATDEPFNDDNDPLLRYLLEDEDMMGCVSPLQPVPAAPPAPRPLSPATCLAAAVLAKRPKLVRRLLAAGTPPNFRLSELPPADVAALETAGMPLASYQHMTPLMVAVRQLSTDVAAELLQGGAAAVCPPPAVGGSSSPHRRSRAAHCRPILLQLLDATAEAAAQAAAAAAVPAPEPNPAGGPDPAAAPATSDTGSMAGGAGSAAAACTAAAAAAGSAAAAAAGSAAVLATSRALLAVLLAHGADPLEQDHTTSRQPTTFMSECLHPALLRLAVTHVQRQCQSAPGGAGRRLTTGECQQLLSAGRRAYAD